MNYDKIIKLIRDIEEMDNLLGPDKVDFMANYNCVAHAMKAEGIPITFYPFLVKAAMGDPVAWANVEWLLGEKHTSHQSIQ